MQQETRENELRQQLPLELAGRLEGQSPQFWENGVYENGLSAARIV